MHMSGSKNFEAVSRIKDTSDLVYFGTKSQKRNKNLSTAELKISETDHPYCNKQGPASFYTNSVGQNFHTDKDTRVNIFSMDWFSQSQTYFL